MIKKSCTKCHQVKPATEKHFGHTESGKLRGVCRQCMANTSREWEAAHPHRQGERNATRARLQKRAGEGYTALDVQKIRKRLEDHCAYCGCNLKGEGVVDHIIAIRQGGSHSASNITLACYKCNADKHSKTPEEFILWREKRGLVIRNGIDWKKHRIPVSDKGVLELCLELLDTGEKLDSFSDKLISDASKKLKSTLLSMLDSLSIREIEVLALRYGIDRSRITTNELIGDKIGLSGTYIGVIVNGAKKELRTHAMFRQLRDGMKATLRAQTKITKV